MIIYKITNKINGKIYLGQTIQSIKDRISNHLADSKRDRKSRIKSKIHRAISKYGIVNFIFEVIDTATSQEELNQKEQSYINLYNSNKNEIGYNLLSGGKQNGKHSEETRLKISIALKRASDIAKQNGKHWNKDRIQTKESNNKRSIALMGIPCPSRGRNYDNEEKQVISKRMKEIRKNTFWSTRKKTITSV